MKSNSYNQMASSDKEQISRERAIWRQLYPNKEMPESIRTEEEQEAILKRKNDIQDNRIDN